ncbi:MAG: glycosyltransferase family 4 protein [Pseudomonadota bacterium]
MHILFLSHYYPPEVNAPASRTSEHCREWVAAGHRVTVLTCAPNHPAGQLYSGYRNRLFQREMMDGVEVIRVWTWIAANRGFLLRTLNYVSYMIGATLALIRLKRPDIVVSTSPQFFCGLTGYIVKILRRVPWVLEVRDIWPESIVTVGAMKKGRLTLFLEWLERFAYRRANAIVALTDSFKSHIAERCGDPDKIFIIKNGVDLRLFNRVTAADEAKSTLGFENKFIAAYVGTHGMAHGLSSVLDAALLTADCSRILYLFVGDGAERQSLMKRAQELQLSNVRFLGQLPKADMPTIWSATDVSLIVLSRNELFRTVLPSKMFEAMAMACPIVLGVEGEAEALLNEAQAGIAVTPEDALELATAVRRLADEPSTVQQFGENGLSFVTANFDRTKLAARYVEVLKSVAASPNRSRLKSNNALKAVDKQ